MKDRTEPLLQSEAIAKLVNSCLPEAENEDKEIEALILAANMTGIEADLVRRWMSGLYRPEETDIILTLARKVIRLHRKQITDVQVERDALLARFEQVDRIVKDALF